MKKVGLLFSGGLESTFLLNKYLSNSFEVVAIYIKSGYIWEETELLYARDIIDYYKEKGFQVKLKIIDVSRLTSVKQLGKVNSIQENIIPIRNLFLSTIAAQFLISKNIYTMINGAQYVPGYPDLSKDYFQKIENLISEGSNTDFKIEIPFFDYTKEEIINLEINKEIPLNLIFSCTNPIDDKMCMNCYKCKSLLNLKLNNID